MDSSERGQNLDILKPKDEEKWSSSNSLYRTDTDAQYGTSTVREYLQFSDFVLKSGRRTVCSLVNDKTRG